MIRKAKRQYSKWTGVSRRGKLFKNIAACTLCAAMASGLIAPAVEMYPVQAADSSAGQENGSRRIPVLEVSGNR